NGGRGVASGRRAFGFGAVGEVPVDRATQAFLERHGGAPAEAGFGARRVDAAAGLAVGFRRIPDQVTVEADDAGDVFNRLADRDLVVGAQVDRLAAVVVLGGEQHAFGRVVDEEVLTGGAPGPPHLDLGLSLLGR